MRRTVFVRQNAERGKPGDAAAGLAGDGAVKISDGVEEGLRALVGIEEHDERTTEFCKCERDGESLRSVGETAEADLPAGATKGIEDVFQGRVTGDAREQLADLGKDHAGS